MKMKNILVFLAMLFLPFALLFGLGDKELRIEERFRDNEEYVFYDR